MGTSKYDLTWSWPLISLNWVPEILGSFETLIEPTWVGLQRTMTTNVAQRSFGNRLFSQLKSFLVETGLVKDCGRYISPCVKPTHHDVKDHLLNYYQQSSQSWSQYYRLVSALKNELYFEHLKLHPPKEWPEISTYSVFKQWTNFFQFIGLGFSLVNDQFIPESAITSNMRKDVRFIEKCFKASCDPRLLTGRFSLHTEADFLAWTKGEDILPISEDNDLWPRIPHDDLIRTYRSNKNDIGAWNRSLGRANEEWRNSIKQLLSPYAFANLDDFISSCKHLLDYFLFGKPSYSNNHLAVDELQRIKRIWGPVKNFKMSRATWQILPNLFRDITRLYWGITYYRNSLKKPIRREQQFNENIFAQKDLDEVRKIPIRCYRSKRTISAILLTLSRLHNSLSRVIVTKTLKYYELETKKLYSMINDYLPSNRLDLAELIREVENLVGVFPHEKKNILNIPQLDIASDYPKNELLQMCFWVHHHHKLNGNSSVKSIIAIKDKLETLKRRLTAEMKQFENGLERWETACAILSEKVRHRRPI